jgi:hypothetical protein
MQCGDAAGADAEFVRIEQVGGAEIRNAGKIKRIEMKHFY